MPSSEERSINNMSPEDDFEDRALRKIADAKAKARPGM